MKPTPWSSEAFKAFSEDTNNYIYLNARTNEYLHVGHGQHENKFFLIGAKGSGKTLLLRYKSYLYHTLLGGTYKFNTSLNELTDNLDISYTTFSKNELLKFQEFSVWENIWSLTLWILAFRTYGVDIPIELNKIINGADQVTPIFSSLLLNRNKLGKFPAYRNQLLLQNRLIQSGVALFIDDVDQALEQILRDEHYTDTDGVKSPAVRIWVNAQLALIAAIYNIYRQNSHIKIFATIRNEPWMCGEGSLKGNYFNYATFLQYEKDEIKQIFEKNIQMMNRENLAKSKGTGLVESFLGFDKIPHRFAQDIDGKPRMEDVFDFLYRHTYGRPREIIEMGRELSFKVQEENYKTKSQEEQMSQVRGIVNNHAYELFNRYKQEIIPKFNEVELDEFVSNINMNIIPKIHLEKLSSKTLSLYHSLGLLGHTTHKDLFSNIFKQEFLPPATYNYLREAELPTADYYLIHPSMDMKLINKLTYKGSYNKINIIGYGYDFYPLEKVNNKYSIEDYMPELKGDKRWIQPAHSYKHSLGLKDYYNYFFNFSKSKMEADFEKDEQDMMIILTLISRICYCNLLARQFGDFYKEKRTEFEKELSRHRIKREYGAEMGELNTTSVIKFKDRLFGRMLVLGCYLFNDLPVASIHHLLMHAEIDFKAQREGEAAIKYLRKCFFIKGLKNNRGDINTTQLMPVKEDIYNYLSKYEKDYLNEFSNAAKEETLNADWIRLEDEKSWLEKHVLAKVWQPTHF